MDAKLSFEDLLKTRNAVTETGKYHLGLQPRTMPCTALLLPTRGLLGLVFNLILTGKFVFTERPHDRNRGLVLLRFGHAEFLEGTDA